jgi:hypothetical protein
MHPVTRKTLVIALVAALLAILAGCTLSDAQTAPRPAPTVTVTESPAPLEKTPQACLDALDHADRGFDLAFKIMDYFGPAMDPVLDMDVSKMHQLTRKMGKAAD